ncbi:Mobilization protein A [Hydrogenovibrio crunogenus]|uniref:Mobilization protein A n=1 Tax=Hydrogenovibrio crunogenus TaxID=39765 RepID=A0A4P7NY86_9GAMM|nr:hypothetical protein [Hydrogenovibrio crunogenus]QBZ82733.1 Mobilization protein A [Hydrogenovibrio crunogenus]
MSEVFLKIIKGKRLSDMSNQKKLVASKKNSNLSSYSPLNTMLYILRSQHSQTNKTDLLDYGKLNRPLWAKNFSEFWDECDKKERKGSVLFRHIIVFLPQKITLEESKNVAKVFSHHLADCFFGTPIPVIWALHAGENRRYKHIHIQFHDRPSNGGTNKDNHFKKTNPKVPSINEKSSQFLDRIKLKWLEFIDQYYPERQKLKFKGKYLKELNEPAKAPTEFQTAPSNNQLKNSETLRNSYEFEQSL